MSYSKRPALGQANMANSEPVVIASNQTAVPVSATDLDIRPLVNTDVVTAELSATDNAVLDAIAASVSAIDTDTTTIIGHVDGIETLIGTTNTTLTTIDGRVDGLETSNSAIQTAVELLDDTVYIDDTSTHSTGVSKGIGIMAVATPTDGSVNANDFGHIGMTTARRLHVEATASGNFAVTMAANATTTPAKARDGVAGANDTGIPALLIRRDTPTAVSAAAGDWEPAQLDANGSAWVHSASEVTDDAAFTPGTNRVQPIAFLADETATDSVDEGDAGIARMTLNRRLITAGNALDDSAFGIGTEYVNAQGLLADETSTDSVDEGDIGVPRMTLDRKQIVTAYPSATGTADGLLVANFNTGDTYTALTNSAQVIKASAGNLYGYYIYNPNSAATYVMIYNIAAASVTVGTSTAQMVFCIPATSGANLMFPYPISFTNAGWSIAAATTGGGNSAPATALEAMIWYK